MYIAMAAEVLEEFDLAQGSLGKDLLAEYIGDFLDGDTFASLSVGCGTAREGRWSVHQFHHTTTDTISTNPQKGRPTTQYRKHPVLAPW